MSSNKESLSYSAQSNSCAQYPVVVHRRRAEHALSVCVAAHVGPCLTSVNDGDLVSTHSFYPRNPLKECRRLEVHLP